MPKIMPTLKSIHMSIPATPTPKEIVGELDKHIIGQADAKRAVAVALRLPAARSARIFAAKSGGQTKTVTRKNVAGIDVASGRGLWFWRLNRSSSSFCKPAAPPFLSAASKAFIVGP